MNIKFEVKMTKKAMFDFMLYTSYTSLSGIVGVIFGGVTLMLGIRQCMFGMLQYSCNVLFVCRNFSDRKPTSFKSTCGRTGNALPDVSETD